MLAVALGPLLWQVPINDIDFTAQLTGPSWILDVAAVGSPGSSRNSPSDPHGTSVWTFIKE